MRRRFAGQAAEELPEGDAEGLGLDVVEGLVDARERGHGHDPALEERVAET